VQDSSFATVACAVSGVFEEGFVPVLVSLFISFSVWGLDPLVDFAADGRAEVQKQESLDFSSSEVFGRTRLDERRNVKEQCVVRGQSVSNDASPVVYDSPFQLFFEDPAVKGLIEELNPFALVVLKTLPNYYDPFGWQMQTGSTGPQEFRLGWTTYNEAVVLPAAKTFGTTGTMKMIEWNSNLKYSNLIAPGVLFNGTFWFDAHWWDGPSGVALPGQVDQISTDLELGLFNEGPLSAQIAFHPQVVESYDERLDKNAFNFDGRAIATYRMSPEWSFVGGVAIWDRVDTMIVPHVGAIWSPNNRWEFRALFPNSRISYFMGNWAGVDWWFYGHYEYSSEAWQSKVAQVPSSDRIQLTDQRLSLGLRCDQGRYSFFAEAGYAFDRHIQFSGSTPAFDLQDAALVTCGLRY
jgi:hypothetical protein